MIFLTAVTVVCNIKSYTHRKIHELARTDDINKKNTEKSVCIQYNAIKNVTDCDLKKRNIYVYVSVYVYVYERLMRG